MFFTFPLLILTVSTLLVYFMYKNKADKKIEDMTTDLLRVNEEKTSIEVKYNKLLSDMKKQDDLKRSKNLDEMQLLFTKVNMLDDKLTFFNTSFKNKLDVITSLLEHNVAQAESLLKMPRADLDEQNADAFEEFEENIANKAPVNSSIAEDTVNEDIKNAASQDSLDLNNADGDIDLNEDSNYAAIHEDAVQNNQMETMDNAASNDNIHNDSSALADDNAEDISLSLNPSGNGNVAYDVSVPNADTNIQQDNSQPNVDFNVGNDLQLDNNISTDGEIASNSGDDVGDFNIENFQEFETETDKPLNSDISNTVNNVETNEPINHQNVENIETSKTLDSNLNGSVDLSGVSSSADDFILDDLTIPELDVPNDNLGIDNRAPDIAPVENNNIAANSGVNDISNRTESADSVVQNVLEEPESLEKYDGIDETVIEDKDLNIVPEPANSAPSISDLNSEQSTLKNQVEAADTMYKKQEQIDADIANNTVDATKNVVMEEPKVDVVDNTSTNATLNNIDDQVQPFDNAASYDIDVLNTDFNSDNDLVNNGDAQDDTKNDVQTDIMSDDELNSALKELDDINLELSEEAGAVDNTIKNNPTLPPKEQNNTIAATTTAANNAADLEDDLDIEGLDTVSKAVNMQNDIEKYEEDVKNNLEPAMDGSIDNNNFDSISEDFLNSTLPEDTAGQQVNTDSGFDIKESIEKLKAQLDDNKDENK